MEEINTNLDFENMTEEELKAFRSQFDPDNMGFNGLEGVEDVTD